ncbi:MAG: response regulator transcription factor [Chloroflexi bacterium]|jgi:DNA-binding response OmpR family regulator|nr:response regulator transcription factor [Chloroflexota bacterium]
MNARRILVVEDEASIAEVVQLYLRRAGFQVQIAPDGRTALDALAVQIPDLVVLDLMLPEVDGLTITRWLRDRSDVPIIMLTARRSEAERIAGLEMGADDYVVKPFSPQELVSRVRAVLRRTHASPDLLDEQPLEYSGFRIDPRTRLVEVNGDEIELTAREFDMLWLLARHPRQVFSRDRLLERVWGLADYIDPSTVTVHIHRLRAKVEADPANPRHILTVWGGGYKFEP